jgi:hypothetical protein
MRKPGGLIVAMFGAPSRFAEANGDLDREHDGGGKRDTLQILYNGLSNGDEQAVHDAQAIAHCLQKMAHAASRRDEEGLDHWHLKCCEVIEGVDGE